MPTTEEAPSGESVTVDEAFARAQELHRSGSVTEARVLYERILEVLPEHVSALHFMGVAEFQLGRSDDAIRLIETALQLDPGYTDAHNNLGNIHKKRGELERARSRYELALAQRPDSPEVLNNLGTILRAEQRLPEALASFEKTLELAPDHVDAHHNHGNVLLALQRPEEALAAFQKALMLRPYDRNSYRHLGAAFYATGRHEDAAEVYRRWAELQPEDEEAVHMVAASTGKDVPARTSNAAVKMVFDQFAQSFDAVLERLDYRAPELVAETLAMVLGAPAANAVILDAGCGTGLGGPLLKPFAERLVGVDISERMLELAVARGVYDEFFVADLPAHLERHPAAYDVVASIDTLVYFGDLAPVVRGLVNALRPSGHVVFTVERAEEGTAPDGFRLNPHGRYSHAQTYIKNLLEGAGFTVAPFREVVLRKEAGKPANGYVVTASVAS
ncbi:MAG TPA: tetratricopeptide repeat protein [Polyangiaceae bacterium]|jgi:predicted TPR repeat methyltransferase|nr:tetratricopeptide repeat protein [Polyangiaceae bacterium]